MTSLGFTYFIYCINHGGIYYYCKTEFVELTGFAHNTFSAVDRLVYNAVYIKMT